MMSHGIDYASRAERNDERTHHYLEAWLPLLIGICLASWGVIAVAFLLGRWALEG